jgi:ribosomal protein L29
MAYGSQGVRDYLKDKRTIEKKLEEVKKATRTARMSGRMQQHHLRHQPHRLRRRLARVRRAQPQGRNLKDVYDALGEEGEREGPGGPAQDQELPNAGALLMKHSMTAPPRPASTSPTT